MWWGVGGGGSYTLQKLNCERSLAQKSVSERDMWVYERAVKLSHRATEMLPYELN